MFWLAASLVAWCGTGGPKPPLPEPRRLLANVVGTIVGVAVAYLFRSAFLAEGAVGLDMLVPLTGAYFGGYFASDVIGRFSGQGE